ncbi:hypothetical protein [Bartonella sp. CB169]|uniref:hypothetical protein n=1 Tax=Bartonella sp. CB169 TaxID=3112257 RepID=UPI00300E26DE
MSIKQFANIAIKVGKEEGLGIGGALKLRKSKAVISEVFMSQKSAIVLDDVSVIENGKKIGGHDNVGILAIFDVKPGGLCIVKNGKVNVSSVYGLAAESALVVFRHDKNFIDFQELQGQFGFEAYDSFFIGGARVDGSSYANVELFNKSPADCIALREKPDRYHLYACDSSSSSWKAEDENRLIRQKLLGNSKRFGGNCREVEYDPRFFSLDCSQLKTSQFKSDYFRGHTACSVWFGFYLSYIAAGFYASVIHFALGIRDFFLQILRYLLLLTDSSLIAIYSEKPGAMFRSRQFVFF